MNSLVCTVIRRMGEAFTTNVTHIWFLTCVGSYMTNESPLLRECLLAVRAYELPFPSVNHPYMATERLLVQEASITNLTLVRFFTIVIP